jgi:signal transduction histidine kinase
MTGSATHGADVPRWQRHLLPGDVLRAPGGRRSTRDWIVDVVMFLLAGVLGAYVLAETWPQHGRVGAILDIACGTVACLALWVRRSRPVAVAVLAVVLATVAASAAGASLGALFNLAIRGSPGELAAVRDLGLASAAVAPLVYSTGELGYVDELLIGVLFTAVVLSWGLFARAQRDLVRSMRVQGEQLEAEHRMRVEQAREAERRRIAGEMHDVLAHRISLLSLHAGALEFRPDASHDEIAEAAGVVRANARAALQELREVIGVLREGAESDAPDPPQPTLADIPALVEESRAAGMRVRCRIDAPDGDTMAPALGRTAYRVVQEGLTNARKHAHDAAVEVTVSSPGRAVLVEVVSRRAVGVALAPDASALPGAGTGLIGLAERVALTGGELHHGPDADGDFVLRAILPRTPP